MSALNDRVMVHEGKAALPRLSDRSRISERAFGRASDNDEDAP